MLDKVYNTEGYADRLGTYDLYYNYYRRDHLGNNREVWLANTNTTIQHTHYYPSGCRGQAIVAITLRCKIKSTMARSLWKCMGWMSMILRHDGIIRLFCGQLLLIRCVKNTTQYRRMRGVK